MPLAPLTDCEDCARDIAKMKKMLAEAGIPDDLAQVTLAKARCWTHAKLGE